MTHPPRCQEECARNLTECFAMALWITRSIHVRTDRRRIAGREALVHRLVDLLPVLGRIAHRVGAGGTGRAGLADRAGRGLAAGGGTGGDLPVAAPAAADEEGGAEADNSG